MQIQVVGKQIDIGDALRGHVLERLESVVEKYFDRTIDGTVAFARDGNDYRADCAVHLKSGMVLHAHSRSPDIYASFEGAIERMEKRLRRYKRRLKDHHAAGAAPVVSAGDIVIAAPRDEDVEPETLDPVVVAESATPLRTLTVGEAVMQLDLAEVPLVMFRNSAHGEWNVVYRRADGNIGWIDPRFASKSQS
ncbi:MAG: ribosome-associated translation inhibitor RaiA [Alphaproteobacteria bacterium]|nr:ribosome-associated translation inhibitor RaiA [Alphaproteobacteria bacterium]